jgi:hypothetical protein
LSSERTAQRQALAVQCVSGMLRVSSPSMVKAHAADLLVSLTDFCKVPSNSKTAAMNTLKKLLQNALTFKQGDTLHVAAETLNLFHCLLSLADQHKALASAAWQALAAAHGTPRGLQIAHTLSPQESTAEARTTLLQVWSLQASCWFSSFRLATV